MSNNSGSKGFLFLINPFISAIDSLIHIRNKQSQRLLYLWFLVFGAAFCALNEAADSFRWVENFYIEAHYTLDQYLQVLRDYFTFDSNVKDIFAVSVNFLVGRFTDNYHWTYFIYAMVFGFFYLKSVKIFLRYEVEDNWGFYSLFFMLCFSNPIFNINGMRMWIAAWIAVYSSLKIFLDKEYRYILLLLVTPLVHDSFFIWITICLIVYLTKKFQFFWIVLFVISSFFSAVSYLDLLQDYSYMLPTFMRNQVWSYTEYDYAIDKMSGVFQEALPLYARIFNALPGYFHLLLVYLLIFNRRLINEDRWKGKMLTILLGLSALTNFLSGIPSMGRFQIVCIPFIVICLAMNPDILKKYSLLWKFVPFVYCYKILYWVRNMVSVTEIWLYICPAPITLFKYLFFS